MTPPARLAAVAGLLLTLAVGLVVGMVLLPEGRSGPPGRGSATLSAVAALAGADTTGFARALEPIPFRFPDDHGPHPDFRTEWWYLTGNLEGPGGEPFGFQLTFFRNALAPQPVGRPSAWDTNQLWMAHFALTDLRGGEHRTGERFARGAAGLAGGSAAPFRVWLGDWELRGGADDAFPMELRASEGDARVALTLVPLKPPVAQGVQGLSQKGPEPGNASYYLSWTRLEAVGEVALGGRSLPVRGSAWMDREWSTSALDEAHVGWDWFSLQLDDGTDLMFFELRREDGTSDPLNHGSFVLPDGTVRPLGAEDVRIVAVDRWESPIDGTTYPSGWRVVAPVEGLELEITPRLRDQEMNLAFRYWEGAVEVHGSRAGAPVRGVGYVELTGYAEEGASPR